MLHYHISTAIVESDEWPEFIIDTFIVDGEVVFDDVYRVDEDIDMYDFESMLYSRDLDPTVRPLS
jgi:hypothetical protein